MPQHLMNSVSATFLLEQHKAWYNNIRAVVSDRITDEDQRMPSDMETLATLTCIR